MRRAVSPEAAFFRAYHHARNPMRHRLFPLAIVVVLAGPTAGHADDLTRLTSQARACFFIACIGCLPKPAERFGISP